MGEAHIDPFMAILLLFAWGWIASPILPMAATWVLFFMLSKARATIAPEPAVLLLLATTSYSWILAGLFSTVAIGPDHSSRRLATIWINQYAMLCIGLWALARGQRLRWLLSTSCLLIASVWFYLAWVGSIV